MKKMLCFAVIAAVAAVACNKEVNDNQDPVNLSQEDVIVNPAASTFHATFANTRTYLDGKSTKWSGTEWISILNGGHNYAFGTTDSGDAATFTYAGYTDGSEETTTPEGVVSTSTLALYPYQETASLSGSTIENCWISNSQTLSLGGFSNQHPILVAKSDADGNLAFKNAASVLKFTLEDDSFTYLWIKGNKSESIAGSLDVTYDGSTLSTAPGAYAETQLNFDNGGTALAAGTYYITVAPTVFDEGLTLQWTDGSKESGKVPVMKTTKAQEFKSNTIHDLGTLSKTSDGTAPASILLSTASAEVGTSYRLQLQNTDDLMLESISVGLTDGGWASDFGPSLLDATNAAQNWTANGLTYYQFYADGSDDWTYEWDIDFPSAGTYIVCGYVYDYAGNQTWYQHTISVTDPNATDTTAPTITLTSPANATVGANYTLVVNFSDASGVSTCYPKIYIYNADWSAGPTVTSLPSGYWNNDSSGHNWGTTVSGTSFDFTLDMTFPSADTYYVYVYGAVSDTNGNSTADGQTLVGTITVTGDI